MEGEDEVGCHGGAGGVVVAAEISEHFGSVHDEAGLEALKAAARQRMAAGQLELGLEPGGRDGGPPPISLPRIALGVTGGPRPILPAPPASRWPDQLGRLPRH